MLKKDPWEGYIKPSKIFGNLYFVGTHPASTHLVDTGDGLMLLDPGYQESLYLVIQNIWELGFDPKNIRYILLTHCHHDHTDATEALVRMSGAKVYFPKGDLPLLKGEIFHSPFRPFTPDVLLEDGQEIPLGNTVVKCISTPGHTDGTMSYFFPVTDGVRTLRAGMHGGVGLNTLCKEFLDRTGLPYDCREKYVASLKKVRGEQVDITLGNHVGQNDTEGKLRRMAQGETDAFVDPAEWVRFLDKCQEKYNEMVEKEQ